MRIYRYIFSQLPGWEKTQHYSHEEIVTSLWVLWPSELLHIHRLRGLIAAVRVGTRHIWALLQADKRWLEHIQEALVWISHQKSMDVAGEQPPIDLQTFINLSEDEPHKARRRLRRAQLAALNMRVREHGANQWHRKFAQQLLDVGFTFQDTVVIEDSHDEAAQEGFLCPVCASFSPHHMVLPLI